MRHTPEPGELKGRMSAPDLAAKTFEASDQLSRQRYRRIITPFPTPALSLRSHCIFYEVRGIAQLPRRKTGYLSTNATIAINARRRRAENMLPVDVLVNLSALVVRPTSGRLEKAV